MAAGDFVWFAQTKVDEWEKFHDLENDDIRLGIVDSTITPTETTSDPRWGAGGTTNLATNEVTAGGNYSAGGPAIANPTVTLSGTASVFDGDDISIAQNASNPTDGRWGIVYNNTDAGKRCLGFLDLGAAVDMSSGPFSVTWNASGICSKD
jgi:hypothetical protein